MLWLLRESATNVRAVRNFKGWYGEFFEAAFLALRWANWGLEGIVRVKDLVSRGDSFFFFFFSTCEVLEGFLYFSF